MNIFFDPIFSTNKHLKRKQTKNNRLDYQPLTNNIQSFIKIFCSFELLLYICSVKRKQNKTNKIINL